MNEDQFEKELIQYLSTGNITKEEHLKGLNQYENIDFIIKKKIWKYEPQIKTTEDLWNNFKEILEQHNQDKLRGKPLTDSEFNQVKKVITELKTPYDAGIFIYGVNGTSQIEVDLDDGSHIYLTVFNQDQIGAGDTTYQIVNQIRRPAKIIGKQERRFDTTLLINGLPIIQIEEKKDSSAVDEALNQMQQYISENQYSDIFSTLQILIAMTPGDVKYMANTTSDKFNKDFAFRWQRKSDNSKIYNWKEFADSMLSIPMAHQMATNYMILDGTKNKQTLKVMRPYQVYATQNVIEKLKTIDFDFGINKVGYIWHTTGSGKTITSFKTAWLASRMPKVDKVVFLVDRIALTKQTNERYRAYDPDSTEDIVGSIEDTKNTTQLEQKLRKNDNSIIVTSVQKLETLMKRKNFKVPDKNIVFIVDEAHRSTGGETFAKLQKTFKKSAWIGYTGTPMFDETTKGLRTEDIFGPLLHAYTISEAISDHNVLGFKVDFQTTIDEKQIKQHYLPEFYKEQHPKWTQDEIQQKIDNLTVDDIDDEIEPSFYDENIQHIKLVVDDIFTNWRNRSCDGKYNAMLTTHVGGNRASTPMAMMYYNEFKRVNEEKRRNGEKTLKVAVTFSLNTTNNDTMLETNQGLYEAIMDYNQEFGTSFGLDTVDEYKQDLISRLDKTASDRNYLDIVIVVDQLLTGFDAPQLNTLYVDRILRGANLIQAYSRTNRIDDSRNHTNDKHHTKPWGRIINYRWPTDNENLMNDALAIYTNKDSANLSNEEKKEENQKSGVIAKSYNEEIEEARSQLEIIEDITDNFKQPVPKSEKAKKLLAVKLNKLNASISRLKQYEPEIIDGKMEGFDYENPTKIFADLGRSMDLEDKIKMTTNLLKQDLAKEQNVSVHEIDLKMIHIKDVEVNYDYLTELTQDLVNHVLRDEKDEAQKVKKEIHEHADTLENIEEAKRIKNGSNIIVSGQFPFEEKNIKYPVKFESYEDAGEIYTMANGFDAQMQIDSFIKQWGLVDVVTISELENLISTHTYSKEDLNDTEKITKIQKKAAKDLQYQKTATDEEVQKLKKIKYRNQLSKAIYKLADKLIEII